MQSQLRQLDNPKLSHDERALLRCRLAKELEEAGDYEAARSMMGELWHRIGEQPNLDGLGQLTAAEVLLRTGALTGFFGSAHQVKGAQEVARGLICESIVIFETLNETEKVAEAQTDLALCYWREGAYDEARVTLHDALSRLDPGYSKQKAVALLRSAMVENSAARYHEAFQILIDASSLFETCSEHSLKGLFHNQLSIVLRTLGKSENRKDYLDRALIEYTAASYHFERAGHTRHYAKVENNLGFLFFTIGHFAEAHEHFVRARQLFVKLKDKASTAQVDETRARVLLAQGHNSEAARRARSAVLVLEKGSEAPLLAEALTTHGTALARLGHDSQARFALQRATEVAHIAGNDEAAGLAAVTMIEELGERLEPDEIRVIYEIADQLLANTTYVETLLRLRACARRAVTNERSNIIQSQLSFHSCFISYSHKDELFAKRLNSRMRKAGVHVWYAPEDVQGGQKLHEQIEVEIKKHDKLLIVLSENSLKSEWVITEIIEARKAELKSKRRKLFPIRLVSMDKIKKWQCFDADSGKDLAIEIREYFIPDFSNWRDHGSFETAFDKLLKDLSTAQMLK